MNKISVVVPVYFNEQSLPILFQKLQEVEAALASRDCELELIFVDDGSKDESFDELLEIRKQRPQTRVIKLARNFGAVTASKTGLRYVTGDAFMWIAADLQEPPDIIVRMVDNWLAGSKYVICIREKRHDPIISKVFSRIYYRLLRLLVIPDYPLGGFDLALMDKILLPYIRDSSKNINTPLLSYWLGVEPKVLFYERQARLHGKSRWTFRKRLGFFIDSMIGFTVTPIRLILLFGFFVAFISLAYGSWIVFNALVGRGGDLAGFPTLVALITFLQSIIIILLGIIGEYIWRIFDQVNQRPEVIVEEVH